MAKTRSARGEIVDFDLLKIKHKSLHSVVMAAHTLLNGETAQRDGRMLLPPLELSRIGKTIIDPEIIEFIATLMTNKGLIPRDANDLRDQIETKEQKCPHGLVAPARNVATICL